MKTISELSEIRVIIHYAPGIGHQTAAITAMKRLRTLGFKGVFDIRYHECEEIERIHTYKELLNLCKEKNMTRYITGLKLEYLISGYKSKDDEIDTSVKIKFSEIGELTITRLPYKSDDYKLDPVDLTLCAADDNIQKNLNTYLLKYNTAHYIALQPTDWVRERFAVAHKKTVYLSAKGRLSENESSIYLPMLNQAETKMLNICHNENFDTQLLYAIGNLSEPSHLNALQRLVKAHSKINAREHAVALLIPEKYEDNREIDKLKDNNIHIIDLSNDTVTNKEYKKEDTIFVFTGSVCRQLFHKMLGRLTTYPPIIEGCNAVDYCESRGLPYIIGGRLIPENDPHCPELGDEFHQDNYIHKTASECLCAPPFKFHGEYDYTYELAEYMNKSRTLQNKSYHEARKNHYLQRPDIVVESLVKSGFELKNL